MNIKNTFSKSKLLIVGAGSALLATSASAAITLPTVAYTDIEAVAGLVIGVVVTVGLLARAKVLAR